MMNAMFGTDRNDASFLQNAKHNALLKEMGVPLLP
jgi:hypothetical protein